jgi:uncharacterized protein (UPF0548 family)
VSDHRSVELTDPGATLTYAEVGATRGDLFPDGYHHLRARARVGRGERVYAAAVHALGSFDMQRAAGLRVRTGTAMAAVGARVDFGFGLGPVRLWAPVQVVWLVNEPLRYGYGYGTLPGHPEAGEEAFLVSLAPDETVYFEVRSFSRPAAWYAKLGGRVARGAQDRTNHRYRAALVRLATTNALPRRAG